MMSLDNVDTDSMTDLFEWPAQQHLQGVTVNTTHNLLETGLFTDDSLIEVFDRHDPNELLVYRMGDDHHALDDFKYGSRGSLSAEQLLAAVQDGKIWLNILNMMSNHTAFEVLVNAIYDELEAKVPSFETVYRSANLLVSSPHAQVYYHADAPLNMLWHLRGNKKVWVYPSDEIFAPQEWVEMIFTRESDDDLPYDPAFDKHATSHDLSPGSMLTWPQNTPHRVENIRGLNVSLTTEHYTPEAMRKRKTYMANRYLREWFHLPMRGAEFNGAIPLLKRTAFRVARRLPGFNEAEEHIDTSNFSLDE
jgi:hypothetical protein